jgi:signal transduction histidine kinase
MFKTIHAKFVIATVIFVLLSVGIPTAFLVSQFRKNFDQRSRIMLESTLDVVHSSITNAMILGQHQKNHIQYIVNNISRNRSVDHVRIISPDGIIDHATDSTEIGRPIAEVAPEHIVHYRLNNPEIIRHSDENIYSMVRPVLNEPACRSCHTTNKDIIAYVDIDTDLTQAERFFYTGSMHMIFLAIAMLVILFFGFYYIFNHFIRKPLLRFRKALDQVEEGNLNISLPAEKDNEIGVLEGHFNQMVKNLKDSNDQIEAFHFEQLQRADKMVTLGELAAEMAHEINNPAGIVMSRADYLQMMMRKNPADPAYMEDLEVILKQVEKISNITGNILKYSKKLPKNFQSLDLIPVIEDSLSLLGPRLNKKKIKVRTIYQVDKAAISGDPVQMEQVLTNLINNAIDAMDPDDLLSISVSRDDRGLVLVVEDTGAGMDEETEQNIFSPFFTTKTGDKGTGLGLYIVKNILKNHGAAITCRSEAGTGTSFEIIFS